MQKSFLLFSLFTSLISLSISQSCRNYQQWINSRKLSNENWSWCNCAENITTTDNTKPMQDDEFNFNFDNPLSSIYEDCGIKRPTLPDFSRPGQRISVTKCYEYIWEIEARMQMDKQLSFCQYSKRRPIYNRPKRYNIFQDLNKNTLIIGGVTVQSSYDFPHMGAVGWPSTEKYWKFMCGSTLISSNFALTAAHCTSALPSDKTISSIYPKIVRFGETKLSDFKRKQPGDGIIKRMIAHPKYMSPSKYFDIALIEFENHLTFNRAIHPACLWTEKVDKIDKAIVTGWGKTDPTHFEGHPNLQAAQLDIIESWYCDRLLHQHYNRKWCGLEEHQICAGQLDGGVDACQGDSGGPLQVKVPLPKNVEEDENKMYYVIGVTSFGIGCGKREIPAIYTKVSHFLDWIEKTVWP